MKTYSFKMLSGNEDINPNNDNIDVEVSFTNGDRYSASFFTLSNIESLLIRYQETKECCAGLYFWASDIIIVKILTEDVIKSSITDLIESGEFYSSFSKLS